MIKICSKQCAIDLDPILLQCEQASNLLEVARELSDTGVGGWLDPVYAEASIRQSKPPSLNPNTKGGPNAQGPNAQPSYDTGTEIPYIEYFSTKG